MAAPTITRPNRMLDIGLAVAVVALGVGSYVAAGPSKSSAAAVTRTTTVAKGVVLSSVQASGNVQAGQTYSVGFQTGGQVIDIDAKVGDVVTKGQVLAHIDPTMDNANLTSAQLGVTSAQAKLDQVEEVLTPMQRVQAQASVTTAQQQVSSAVSAVSAAQQQASLDATQLQQAVDSAQSKLDDDTTAKAPATAISQDQSALTQAQNQLANTNAKDQQAITSAQSQVTQATNQLNSTIATNNASAELQPADLDSAKASVAQAQIQVMTAMQAVGWTTLQAPADGVVTAVSGTVGQTVSGSGVSTSTGSTTSGAASTAASSSSSSSGSASSAFMTITNVDALSVKAGFAETDATKLRAGQPAAVSFSALPAVQAAGVVTSVDVNSTLVSNVVTYFATVALTKVPDGVKPGMTASVTITVDKREGVLNLPSAAVRGTGTNGTVTVVSGKTQTTKAVGVGLRGDTTTEITTGLNVGDTVVLSSGTVSGVSTQLGTGTGARFGGGAGLTGGLGGGGGGAVRRGG